MIVLFSVLFLYGAIGMERRRGMLFAIATGTLLFVMALPAMLTEENPTGSVYSVFEIIVVLLASELTAIVSFFLGTGFRRLFQVLRGRPSQH